MGSKILLLSISLLFYVNSFLGQVASSPKLILQVTVDQLRGDMPFMVENRWSEGGFKYLYENGVWYTNGHHPHANNETIVGHVTLATGTYPSNHGMVGNVWFNDEEDRLVYNIEDSRYSATEGMVSRDSASEVDNSQVSRSEGRSPHNILTTTISDEIRASFGNSSKIFAVSGKDRGAVSMVGHSGMAFWYSTNDGNFTSSTFYYDEFPKWVRNWNEQRQANHHFNKSWSLKKNIESYRAGLHDDRPFENPADLGFGRTFPHPFGDKNNKYYYTLLMSSPVVDELTVSFAKELMAQEEIGRDDIPDYLSISLSATDYIGHLFGPMSLETEENLLRLDKTLEDLFTYVDEQIGLENTLIVLSADHGAPEAVESLQSRGFPMGTVNLDKADLTEMDARLQKEFGIGKEVIKLSAAPYVYLDEGLLEENGLSLRDVSKVVAEEYAKFDGVAQTYTGTEIESGDLPNTALAQKVIHNHHPRRSGDIYLIFEPNWRITFDGDVALVNHGSPWKYDSHVPVVFAQRGFQGRLSYKEVSTIDVAITLAKYLKINEPSAAMGKPLNADFKFEKQD